MNIRRSKKTTPKPKPASFSTSGWRQPKSSYLDLNSAKKIYESSVSKKILLVVGVIVLGFGGGWLGATAQNNLEPSTLSNEARQQYISNESELISEIATETGQSVVSINVESEVDIPSFFGPSSSQSQSSAGTGFIVSSDGVVVTNRHVVPSKATNVSVTLSDGTKLSNVEVIGRSSGSSTLDVAFLKIKDVEGKQLVPAKLGDSSKVKVGDKVVAIGNALGQFENTVTAGIISGYGRDVVAGGGLEESQSLSDLFQTDAAINQGNSGGPLVNINGEVIGINTAVAGRGAQNIGFAIPINNVQGLISTVLETGIFQQPYLGVRYVSLTDDIAYQLNLETKRGAYIAPGNQLSIIPGSPAQKADLREKDIIIKVNSIELNDEATLAMALARFRVGDNINLSIIRDGQPLEVTVTLEAAPADL